MISKGATIDVGAWLRGLGLGEYEATFRENAINEKVLPNLTAEDLKDMGFNIVGHRRVLLDAIAALRRSTPEHLHPRHHQRHHRLRLQPRSPPWKPSASAGMSR